VDDLIETRKADHLRLSASGDVDALVGPGWDDVRLVHEALPEVDQCAIDLSVSFLGQNLRAPLVIAGMTGGHRTAHDVNAVLARAAVAVGVAAVFIETHENPDRAPSDGPNMIALKDLPGLLRVLIEFDRLAKAPAR